MSKTNLFLAPGTATRHHDFRGQPLVAGSMVAYDENWGSITLRQGFVIGHTAKSVRIGTYLPPRPDHKGVMRPDRVSVRPRVRGGPACGELRAPHNLVALPDQPPQRVIDWMQQHAK